MSSVLRKATDVFLEPMPETKMHLQRYVCFVKWQLIINHRVRHFGMA